MKWISGCDGGTGGFWRRLRQCCSAGFFGMERAWTELHSGSDIQIPGVYRLIIKYVTPLFLIAILVTWFVQEWVDVFFDEKCAGVQPTFCSHYPTWAAGTVCFPVCDGMGGLAPSAGGVR